MLFLSSVKDESCVQKEEGITHYFKFSIFDVD